MNSFWRNGTIFIWLTGLATATGLLMIGALLVLILVNGLGIFWPSDLVELQLTDGTKLLGEVWEKERMHRGPEQSAEERLRLKIGNRDFYGLDFRWVPENDIAEQHFPKQAFVLERRAWGNFFGFIDTIRVNGKVVAAGIAPSAAALPQYLDAANDLYRKIRKIEKSDIGEINYQIEQHRLEIKRIRLSGQVDSQGQEKIRSLEDKISELEGRYHDHEARLLKLNEQGRSSQVHLRTVDGQSKELGLMQVVRAYQPNALSMPEKAGVYLSHLWEFLSGEPREANTEGGVFPAIFGTVLMVIIMSIAVVPLGVIAAIYMREYARGGLLLTAVRIAINNLAGVPSIVFGVFGLGFFIYTVGGSIDRLFFSEALPTPTFGTGGILWASLTLALLTLPVVIITAEEGLAAVPRSVREASLALGATKIETLWRVILPSALPAIFTGLILAISRAAGEVAPLMITGVVKLAPSLPLDGQFPFLHLERKFMHLGFHIYDVGFQSPNVEAALPMVYATTLLLILIVLVLNLAAILMRSHLQRKFSVGKM